MSHDNQQPEQLLDQAIDALKQRGGADDCPPDLSNAVLNAINATEAVDDAGTKQVESSRTLWTRIKTMPTWTRVAAVFVFAVILSIAVLPLGGNGDVLALAAVLKKVEQAEAATFTLKLKVKGQPEFTIKQTIADPGWVINELAGVTIVTDLRKRQSLQLVHGPKEAYLIDITALPESQRPKDVVAYVKRVDPDKAKFLRKEKLNGRETLVYDVSEDYGKGTIWVDAKTELPVQYHLVGKEKGKELELKAESFDWNPKIDRTRFTLNVPEGYTVKELAVPKNNTQALIEFLRTWTTLSEGKKYPDLLTPITLSSINALFMDTKASPEEQIKQAKVTVAKLLGKPTVTEDEFTKWRHEFMQTAIGVSVLLTELASDMDRKFHWQGKGVTFGQKNKPIAWWRIKDKQTYQVIYADLTTKQVNADALPKE